MRSNSLNKVKKFRKIFKAIIGSEIDLRNEKKNIFTESVFLAKEKKQFKRKSGKSICVP